MMSQKQKCFEFSHSLDWLLTVEQIINTKFIQLIAFT